MGIKKYKVVCSKPQFSDEVYIDIAQSSGIIHDQIFFSRIQLHNKISNQPLSRLYGSVYLTDDNGEVSVEFPCPQVRKDSPEYAGIKKQYAELEPKIIERYRRMIEGGQQTTLFVYNVSDMFELSESKNKEAQAFEEKRRRRMVAVEQKIGKSFSYKTKHLSQISYPQTPQQEEMLKQNEQFKAAKNRRVAGIKKRAKEHLAAWQRFQMQYSGD